MKTATPTSALFLIFALLVGTLLGPATQTLALQPLDPGEFEIPAVLPLNTKERAALQQLTQTNPQAATLLDQARAQATPLLGTPATPLEVIRYEGLINTDPRRIETVRSLKQMGDAALLLRYWQATEDPAAAETLRIWTLAWARTYRFTGNDVNENKFVPLLIAYVDLREGFAPADRHTIDRLVRQFGEHHAQRAAASDDLDNRFSKHLRIAALAGLALHETDWINAARDGTRRFVAESLRPDGSSFDLEQRDTLTYHGSALKPMIELSILFDRNAEPNDTPLYFHEGPDGASIAKSVDYVLPYARGEKTRDEWKNSRVDLDHARARAGIEHYQPGKTYDPPQAAELLELAAHYRPELTPLVAQLTSAPESQRQLPTWLILTHAALRDARSSH